MMSSGGATVLILDGHTMQALATVRSLARAGYRVLVASHRRIPLGGWSRHCAGTRRIEGETPKAFGALKSWAISQGVSLVLPMTERSCVLCNLDRDAWEEAGVTLGCAPTEALFRAFDKSQTLEFAAAADVRAPVTRTPGSYEECIDAASEIGYPCIVKPRFSSAWTGEIFLADGSPRYVDSEATLLDAVRACRQGVYWPVIQQIVPGQGKGAFALFDKGEPVVWFAHERLRDVRPTGAGSSLRRSVVLDPRLREPAERLLRAMRWHGPAMVEFRDDGVNEPYLIEVNGRFWGSLQLAIAAGVDFPRLWACVLRDDALPALAPYTSGVTVRWLWGDIKRFLTILAGPPRGYTGQYPTVAQGLVELFGAQPAGTRFEAWESDDRWPGVGEWVQGMVELADRAIRKPAARRARVRREAETRARAPRHEPGTARQSLPRRAPATPFAAHEYAGDRSEIP